MTKKLYYTFTDLKSDLSDIVNQMTSAGYRPDVVIGPGRGAYVPGVMLSHYYGVPFEGFKWQTRDGQDKDSAAVVSILSKYKRRNILFVDDVNDTGETLAGISSVIDEYKTVQPENPVNVRYVTLFNKESSKFKDVDYCARLLTPDHDPWIVFPYEQWWK
jgi:hypoxanthine phosphoribosyltransferase